MLDRLTWLQQVLMANIAPVAETELRLLKPLLETGPMIRSGLLSVGVLLGCCWRTTFLTRDGGQVFWGDTHS